MSDISLKNLRIDHWSWIHAKCALALVGYLYFFETPPSHLEELGDLLTYLIGAFICLGALISVVGLVVSTGNQAYQRHRGYTVELFGLIIACTGMATFVITQFVLLDLSSSTGMRAAFVYALLQFLVSRALVIYRALSRG